MVINYQQEKLTLYVSLTTRWTIENEDDLQKLKHANIYCKNKIACHGQGVNKV